MTAAIENIIASGAGALVGIVGGNTSGNTGINALNGAGQAAAVEQYNMASLKLLKLFAKWAAEREAAKVAEKAVGKEIEKGAAEAEKANLHGTKHDPANSESVATDATKPKADLEKTDGVASDQVRPNEKPGDISITKSKFGHTFETHGEDNTNFLLKKVQGSGQPQGQFLDNQAAARFISENLQKLKNGAVSLPVPKNLSVRIINPDGTFASARNIKIVPSGSGVKTAYPEP
ncbi:hypothetical protein [Asaia bogorensis]|uniref:hypothetical protein n=1 Tax=Asaia bogorensis TaxID=91915 RepID=UPI00286CF3C0|nr:hypothetical protein [Asaia bogorensis]